MAGAAARIGFPCYELLGVRIHPATIPELNAAIAHAIDTRSRCIIGCHNLHSVHEFHRDPHMREFYDLANLIPIDGMTVVAMARLLGYPVTRDHRATWMDWLDPLMELAAERRWRVYYLGSAPGIAERAAAILCQRYPGLNMKTHHGYFDARADSQDTLKIRSAINDYSPNLLMVGMGQPRQEKWVCDNAALITANVIVTPGACLDYVAGEKPKPWRFLGRIGLEWAFRLASEPRRLSRRYLIEPWSLTGLVLTDLVHRYFPRKAAE
jgi:N-acetylglucosaminyldiphosphoundecaprenol N-acetyl-beta-D-mannosaminyltransferase